MIAYLRIFQFRMKRANSKGAVLYRANQKPPGFGHCRARETRAMESLRQIPYWCFLINGVYVPLFAACLQKLSASAPPLLRTT
jgi:hypothetical protein